MNFSSPLLTSCTRLFWKKYLIFPLSVRCEVFSMVTPNLQMIPMWVHFHVPEATSLVLEHWIKGSFTIGCSLSWQSSLRRCQSDAASDAAAGVGRRGGGSCRSGVTPVCVSPSLPAATLLQHSKHTLSCLISQQRQQQPQPDICWHVAGEGIVGASQFLMQATPSFPLHYVSVLILLVRRQHRWSCLTTAKASSHF